MKGEARRAWTQELVLDFWQDYLDYQNDPRPPGLELCVNSLENEVTMARNRTNDYGENRPNTSLICLCLPRRHRVDGAAVPSDEICTYLDDLALVGFHDDLWEYTWTDILSGFRKVKHQGMIADIFDVVVHLSRSTIRSLRMAQPDYEGYELLIEELNNIEELHFAADSIKMVVTMTEEDCLTPPTHVYAWNDVFQKLNARPC